MSDGIGSRARLFGFRPAADGLGGLRLAEEEGARLERVYAWTTVACGRDAYWRHWGIRRGLAILNEVVDRCSRLTRMAEWNSGASYVEARAV